MLLRNPLVQTAPAASGTKFSLLLRMSAMTGSIKKVKRDGSQEATSLEDSPNLVPTPVVSRNWALLTSEMGSLCATALRASPPLLGKGLLHHRGEWEGKERASPDPGAPGPTFARRTWWVQAGHSLLFLLLKSSVCESRRQICLPVCLSLSGQAAQEGLIR